MEIKQIQELNKNLKQIFIEYQITLAPQRTTIQINGSWTDKRFLINIIYYQRLLKYGNSWIKQNQQSPEMRAAIDDFDQESQRYINEKFSSDPDDKIFQLTSLLSVIEFLKQSHEEEDIMEQLLLFYTQECFFYRMLQEYLRLQKMKNLYYVRLPIYFCMKGLSSKSNVKKKLKLRLFRGQYVDKKEMFMYQNQQKGSKNIMLSFLSCSTIQLAKQFIYKDIEGLDKVILDFRGFNTFKELKSDFNEIEINLSSFVQVRFEKQQVQGNHKSFQFKQKKFKFNKQELSELQQQKENIMKIFNLPYQKIQLIQAEFSLMYDRDPQFVIDLLGDKQFVDLDEMIRLSKLLTAYRMLGKRSEAIKFGEQCELLLKQKNNQQYLELIIEFGWVLLDDQQFSQSMKKNIDGFFSQINKFYDQRAQILNIMACIYWNIGQNQKGNQCISQSWILKSYRQNKFDLLNQSIAKGNQAHGEFQLLMNQDFPDEIRAQKYSNILDVLLECVNERSKVRDYCHNFDLVILQRISFVLFEMGNIKECQDYCDYVDNLITENNNYYESVGLNYYVRAKLLIDAKNYEGANHYFQKSIKYLNDNKYNRRIELIRIYSDYEDFCLKSNNIDQATIIQEQVHTFQMNSQELEKQQLLRKFE